MAQLAIKGHETRGKEVIEILEMLGAKNCGLKGCGYNLVYYIRTDGYIATSYTGLGKDYKVFTLEEFLEKFPYKVGDSVSSKYLKNYKIEKAEWVSRGNRVIYKLQGVGWHSVEDLQPNKEETIEETNTMNHTTEINLNHPCFKGCNEIELIIPKGWEFKRKDNKMFGVRKQYPKTYEECCMIIGFYSKALKWNNPFSINSDTHPYIKHLDNLIESFQRLLVCRDAYWKIAGEEMEHGKPWVPNWNDNTEKYVIYPYQYLFSIDKENYRNTVLAFPTKEMRDVFYENFIDLIEECKKFL